VPSLYWGAVALAGLHAHDVERQRGLGDLERDVDDQQVGAVVFAGVAMPSRRTGDQVDRSG